MKRRFSLIFVAKVRKKQSLQEMEPISDKPPPPPRVKEFYYSLDREHVFGPVSADQLLINHVSQTLTGDVFVCEKGKEDWKLLSELRDSEFSTEARFKAEEIEYALSKVEDQKEKEFRKELTSELLNSKPVAAIGVITFGLLCFFFILGGPSGCSEYLRIVTEP